MFSFGKYAKAITALVTAILGWFAVVIAASPDSFHVSNSQWLGLGVALATALGVYGMPNQPSEPPVQGP
jgi:hypothetical protein